MRLPTQTPQAAEEPVVGEKTSQIWALGRTKNIFQGQVLPEGGVNHPAEVVSSLAPEGARRGVGPSMLRFMKTACAQDTESDQIVLGLRGDCINHSWVWWRQRFSRMVVWWKETSGIRHSEFSPLFH